MGRASGWSWAAGPCVLCLLCVLGAGCHRTVLGGPPSAPVVTDVEVEGAAQVRPGLVAKRLATVGSGGLLPGTGVIYRLDRGALAEDLRRVVDIYEEQGFYAARASVELEPAGGDEVRVRFVVDEGPPALVRTLLVAGLCELPAREAAAVLSDPPLAAGDRLVESRYLALQAQLRDRLLERGHATAEVRGAVSVGPAEGSADVFLTVTPGPVYRFGEIEVVGQGLVPAEKIRAAARLAAGPSRRFSPDALEEVQREVFTLGTFSAVTVTTLPPAPGSGRLPLRVAVIEADYLRFRAGTGVGIDESRQQARVTVGLTHLNLFGGLQRLDFDNELAYRFLAAGDGGDQRRGIAGSSSVELVQPDIHGPRLELAVRASYERELAQAYESQAVTARLGTPLRLSRGTLFTPSYNVRYYFDVTGAPPLAGGRASPLLLGCPAPCVFSWFEQRLTVDRRDDPLEPRGGWYSSLGVQEGGGPLGGGFSWFRVLPELRGYRSLSTPLVLAGRLELGFLQPVGSRGSPIVARFFGGGAGGFRGLPAGWLSPLIVTEEGDLVPIGGNSSLLASIELRYYLSEWFAFAWFVDGGDVEARSSGVFTDLRLQLAAGSGVRLRTPVGPLRFDLGYRVLQRPRYAINGAGVPVEESWSDYLAIFFSLGEAF